MSAGMKSARSTPLLGLAFFTSAMTAAWPAAIFARRAASKSRVSTRVKASSRTASSGFFFLAAVTSSCLTATIWSRMSLISACQRLGGAHQLVHLRARRAGLQRGACTGDPVRDAGSDVGGVQRRARIEHHDVARRAALVVQHLADQGQRLLRRSHLERTVARHGQAEVLGVDLVLADLAVPQLADQGGCAQAH